MLIVYIPGVWDLLHVGHVAILERAAAFGDRLVVGVPHDEIVRQDKGELPIIPLEDRMRMLQSLKCVDIAIPYVHLEFLSHLQSINPDIVAVGSTWGKEQRHIDAEAWIEKNGKRFIKIPYTAGISTTHIKGICSCRRPRNE